MTFQLRTGPGVLRLLSLPGVGERSVQAITDEFETWTDLVGTPDWRLTEILGKAIANRLLPHLEKPPGPAPLPNHLQVISRWDQDYPRQLLNTSKPPILLWCWGTPPPQASTPLVAIVGTRTPTGFGQAAAVMAATRAAQLGVGVISGLAVGIDQAASVAAMDAGGKTWVYLGGGHESMNTAQQVIAARIYATGGGVLAEVPPPTPVAAHQLTARNRLQSGTAHATFIAQTRLPDGNAGVGTMHTVRHTIQQYRLLAVACPNTPWNGDPATAGNYALADPDGINPDHVYATR
ncbi:MAG: DNA-processing protein DprA, partial [Propionicimonas sp.]